MTALGELAAAAGGGFDGVLGFSQGAVMAHSLCWLAEQPPEATPPWAAWVRGSLKFAIFIAGFPSRLAGQQLAEATAAAAAAAVGGSPPLLQMPSLHFSCANDPRVPSAYHRELADRFAAAKLLPLLDGKGHPKFGKGAHGLPSLADDAAAIAAFVAEAMADRAAAAAEPAAEMPAADHIRQLRDYTPVAPGPALAPAVQIVGSGAALPRLAAGFSLLSFNMLANEWFSFKYYAQHVPDEARRWPHRKRLMAELLLRLDADVVAIQEGSATLATDFDFMAAAGYEHLVYERKFRMPMVASRRSGLARSRVYA